MKNYLIKEYMENGVLDIERVMLEFTPYIYAIINNKKIILIVRKLVKYLISLI